MCEKHFLPEKKLQTFWGYLEKNDPGSQTNFEPLEQLYPNWRASEKTIEMTSKEKSERAARLIWADDNIHLDDSLAAFIKNTRTLLIRHLRLMTLIKFKKLRLISWNVQLRTVEKIVTKISDRILQIMLFHRMKYATIMQDFHQLVFLMKSLEY